MAQHRGEAAQAEVIVVLFGELLGGELIERVDFLGENARVAEALAEQRDLGDVVRVGHDHRNGSEHGLEIVGQLGAARVARIHCDEDAARGHQLHDALLNVACRRLARESVDN